MKNGVAACTLSDPIIDSVVAGANGDPFAVLGPHEVADGWWEIRVFAPQALHVSARLADGRHFPLEPVRAGFFSCAFDHAGRPVYRLVVDDGRAVQEMEDIYGFGPSLDDEALSGVQRLDGRRVYDLLGAHIGAHEGANGARFAVWAPNARRVSVVGDFNAWDGRRCPMRKHPRSGVWEVFVPAVEPGQRYKFELVGADGRLMPLKADPLAFAAERPPATASITRPREKPATTFDTRHRPEPHNAPMSIYECHLGSWARKPEEGNRWLTYRELAETLVPYVKRMGFTHIELLPITEFPFDGSWGYQPISIYAPTSRFGTPDDFRAFVDVAQASGIGVILDWVPAHFPNDAHGLAVFDGTHLYEHADPRQGYHQDWGTCIYNFGRAEVVSFLVDNACFWVTEYGLDGLRVDAVASMLYLDYSRKAGEWVPNRYGGNENLEAIDFLRAMNAAVYEAAPTTLTIAEESTAWPGVSRPTWAGGLGFGFKWNMGWMHDTLQYMARDPLYRRYHHSEMTFGLVYAFSENFVLPLSHDEVVHGKGSLIAKMPGDRWQKFANLRAYFGFMWAHPGKKLLFMGGEFAQVREWSHESSLDWHLLDDPLHGGMCTLVRDLNALYRATPALWECDSKAEGFSWIVGDDRENSVFVFMRHATDGSCLLAASNFTPVPRSAYRVGVPAAGRWREVLNTDASDYGGGNIGNLGALETHPEPSHGHNQSLSLTLPPLATLWFVPD